MHGCLAFFLPTLNSIFLSFRVVLTLGGASLSGRTQDGGFGLGPGPSEVGSEFWRMTAPRALGVAVGVGTAAGSGSWEAGKAARFRVGWSCRDWDRGTGAAYGFSGTRCATRLCRERPGRMGSLLWHILQTRVWAEKSSFSPQQTPEKTRHTQLQTVHRAVTVVCRRH